MTAALEHTHPAAAVVCPECPQVRPPALTQPARTSGTLPPLPPETAGLTDRHVEILRLVADGLTGDQIARRLGLAPDTVKSHLRKAFRTLGASGRAHATLLALRAGVIR